MISSTPDGQPDPSTEEPEAGDGAQGPILAVQAHAAREASPTLRKRRLRQEDAQEDPREQVLHVIQKDLLASDVLISLFATAAEGFRHTSTLPKAVPEEFKEPNGENEWDVNRLVRGTRTCWLNKKVAFSFLSENSLSRVALLGIDC